MKIVVDKEYLEDLINNLVVAERAVEVQGGARPEDMEEIARELKDTREALGDYLESCPTVKD